MHFGPKQIAFWPKTECILAQNRMHFGPKQNAFCRKMECVLPQNANCYSSKALYLCGFTSLKAKIIPLLFGRARKKDET